MKHDLEIDARGLICPLPVLKAAKVLRGMAPGDLLHVHADDPVAIVDIPHFCQEAGHDLVSSTAGKDGQHFVIRRGADPANE